MNAGLYNLPDYSFFSMTRKEPKKSLPPGAPRSPSTRRRSFMNMPGTESATHEIRARLLCSRTTADGGEPCR